MKGNHPKRRRDKYNPYWICEKDGTYYISFKDGQNVAYEFEISRDLYEAFDYFELEDLKYLNECERHHEREEVRESALNARAVHKPEGLEEIVLQKIQIEKLQEAMQNLSETQRRRIYLYFFKGMTFEQIAEKEGCSKVAAKYTIEKALKNLKKF